MAKRSQRLEALAVETMGVDVTVGSPAYHALEFRGEAAPFGATGTCSPVGFAATAGERSCGR
jgi:hypothetical protein